MRVHVCVCVCVTLATGRRAHAGDVRLERRVCTRTRAVFAAANADRALRLAGTAHSEYTVVVVVVVTNQSVRMRAAVWRSDVAKHTRTQSGVLSYRSGTRAPMCVWRWLCDHWFSAVQRKRARARR